MRPARRPRVLVAVDYYLPGYRAGGPIRTIAAMMDRLGDEYDFHVLTSDRDLGDAGPYEHVEHNRWTPINGGSVYFVDRGEHGAIRRVLRELQHDVLYLNSFFSYPFSIRPLIDRRRGAIPRCPVVLAPRGEFADGALRHSAARKWVFRTVAQMAKLHDGVLWQASSDREAAEIVRRVGSVDVLVSPDLALPVKDAPARSPKAPGRLNALFLSRISPTKNLHGALEMLRHVQGSVSLTVCGPVGDEAYWQRCQSLIDDLPPWVSVTVRGEIPHAEVRSTLSAHDVLFLPTLNENFGHAILESLDAGTPVLISDRTPWRGLEAGRAGWDLSLSSSARFVEVLEHLVAMGDAEFSAWSRGARAFAQRWFDSDTAAEGYRTLLRSALEATGPSGPSRSSVE